MFETRSNGKGKPYNAKLRSCIYFLRSRQIGVEHIAPIIKNVLSLVDVEVDQLPCKSTSLNLNSELGYITRKQIVEELDTSNNLTMHRDATTKKGHHFYGVELSNGTETYTVGLREVADGKSDTYTAYTKEILKDLNTSTGSSEIDNGNNILSKVNKIMTDRSSTEVKVNKNLSKDIFDMTNSLPNSFKCAVHPLLQFREVCEKELIRIENDSLSGCEKGTSETKTVNLIKFVANFFYKDGSGDPLLSVIYLKSVGISSIPITKFIGNRFNCLFYNAAGTFYLAKHLEAYLKNSKSTLNFTQDFITLG